MKFVTGLLLISSLSMSRAFCNDKGNTFDSDLELSPMGQMMGYELRVGIYSPLSRKEIVRGEGGVFLVSGIGMMAGAGEEFVPLQEILSARAEQINAYAMGAFFDFVVGSFKQGKTSTIHALTSGQAFYAAFGTLSLKAALELETVAAAEREEASRMLDGVTLNFWEAVKAAIVEVSGTEGWRSFSSGIDAKKLGYSLPQ